MRLPYLQVTQEAWTSARMLAGVLGIKRREALGLVLDLWAWGLYLGPDDEPPAGVCDSPRAVALMAGALEWDGDAETLCAAFVDVDLLERLPTGVRVRGLDRYRSAWEKSAKSKARKAKWMEERVQNAPGTRSERVPNALPAGDTQKKTQTQTQTQTGFSSFAGTAEADPPKKPAKSKPPPDPRHAPLVAALVAAVPGYRFNGGIDAKAVADLIRLGSDAEILDRWRRANASSDFPRVRTLPELAKHFNHFRPPDSQPLPEQKGLPVWR